MFTKNGRYLIWTFSLLILIGFSHCTSKTDKSKNSNAKEMNGETSEDVAGSYVKFDRVRIEDKVGFQQPVEAFSMLLPSGWQTQGEIIWIQPNQPCAGNNLYLKSSAPDQAYSFEMFPSVFWSATTNQELSQFQQQQPQTSNCYYGEPLDARQYLTQVFAKQALGDPQIISFEEIKDAAQLMMETNQKTQSELQAYGAGNINFKPSGGIAKVKWNDGKEGLVMLLMNNAEITIPNAYTGGYDINYSNSAVRRLLLKYPAGEEEKARRMLTVIMSSYRTNPSWKETVDQFWLSVRKNRQQIHIGKLQAMDAQTREIGNRAIASGNQRLQDMDNQLRNWEAKQQSQDRMHTQFVKTIREVEHYKDETGTIELGSGYNHAWSRSDGSSFIMTDNPNFDPSSVFQDQQWKEMKKVP